MRFNLRNAMAALMAIGLLLICNRAVFADDADKSPAVLVKYASGAMKLDRLVESVKIFSNKDDGIRGLPAELADLSFTRRSTTDSSDATLNVPANATVFLLVDVRRDRLLKDQDSVALNNTLTSLGFSMIGGAGMIGTSYVVVFQREFEDGQRLQISGTSAKRVILVASRNLALDTRDNFKPDRKPDEPADTTSATTLHIDRASDTTPILGPSTRPARSQASITALEVYEEAHGMMLGQTTEETLTLTASLVPRPVVVRFVTKVGDDTCLARDEALRYIHLKYPNWDVGKAEITFEDKYVAHDGGSGGTAVGTMILSCIQGFAIDPDVAITGDISANGKVRAIGGVSAKIKGAIASKCSLVAIPSENADQLVDAVVYGGPELVSEIQVIGISNLDDAVATVRSDRAPELTEAIALFGEVQKSLKDKPGAVKDLEIQEKLHKVLYLAPQHLSAQVLLSIAEGKEPKTLSATASLYYTFLATGNMMDALKQRDQSNAAPSVPSSVVRTGLANLRKLRPLADPNVRPLIDAWARFIGAWNEMQERVGSAQSVEEARQSLLDEMAKEDANVDLMQKMLKEGM